MVGCAHLVPCVGERKATEHGWTFAVTLTNEMLDQGEPHNGTMEGCWLCGKRAFVGLVDGFGRGAKGHHGLQTGVENDGVIGVAQGFEAVHQGLGTVLVLFEKCHGVLNKAHADSDGGADLEAVRKLNTVKQALNVGHVGSLGLVEQSVFEQGDGRLEQPASPLFGTAVVQLFVEDSLRRFSIAFEHGKSVGEFMPPSVVFNRFEVGSDSGRFLTMQGNAPGPVMKVFVLGSLLRCPVKNHGHGTALVDHQLLKSLFKGFLNAFILQRKLVIEMKDCKRRIARTLGPMLDSPPVEHTQPLFVQHGSANVANQVLNLNLGVTRGPPQKRTFVKFAKAFGAQNVRRGERTREEHHVVERIPGVLGQAHQHRLLDKGLNVSAGFRERVTLPVEIERHRMAVEGFGDITSLFVLKMIAEQLDGVLRRQRTEMKQRPIKRCWHRETTGEHHLMTSVAKRSKKMDHSVLMAFTEPVNVVNDQHPLGSVDVLNHGVEVPGERAGGCHPLTCNGLSVAELVHRCPANGIALVGAPRPQKGRLPDA